MSQAERLLAKAEEKQPKTFDNWIEELRPALEQALPEILPVDRFARMVITCFEGDEKLQQCTPQSIMGAAIQAAQVGLTVGNNALSQAHLVPYSNFKGYVNGKPHYQMEAQLQIGYRGYADLGYRTGKIRNIRMEKVYATDEFDYEYGANEFLRHKPTGLEDEKDRPTHYYVAVYFNDGSMTFLVRTYKQLLKHAKRHTNLFVKNRDTGEYEVNRKSNWFKHWDAMCLKTVIRELFSKAQVPLSTDVLAAVAADGSVKNVFTMNDIKPDMATEAVDIAGHVVEDDEGDEAAPTAEDYYTDANAEDAASQKNARQTSQNGAGSPADNSAGKHPPANQQEDEDAF